MLRKNKTESIGYWKAFWLRFKKNKMAVIGGVFVLILIALAILAPYIAPYPYDEPHYTRAFEGPSKDFIFGTDALGRDLFSRILYSLRNASIIGFGSQFVVLIIGGILGAVAGFKGGWIDKFIMSIVDIMFAFPTFLFNVILVTALGRGLFTIFLAIGLTGWAGMARLVRGQVLYLKNSEFVEAAKAAGASTFYIIRKHILPNMIGPILVNLAFGVPGAMMTESGLAVIGMGVRPPMPSWGNLIGEGIGMMMAFPHLLIFPAVTFAFTLISFTFLADGLRDAFNPRSEIS